MTNTEYTAAKVPSPMELNTLFSMTRSSKLFGALLGLVDDFGLEVDSDETDGSEGPYCVSLLPSALS